MWLGNFEYAETRRDSTGFGPFDTEDDVMKELGNHVNPGGFDVDRTGTYSPLRRNEKGEMR
jgi:hypothetical protein